MERFFCVSKEVSYLGDSVTMYDEKSDSREEYDSYTVHLSDQKRNFGIAYEININNIKCVFNILILLSNIYFVRQIFIVEIMNNRFHAIQNLPFYIWVSNSIFEL